MEIVFIEFWIIFGRMAMQPNLVTPVNKTDRGNKENPSISKTHVENMVTLGNI